MCLAWQYKTGNLQCKQPWGAELYGLPEDESRALFSLKPLNKGAVKVVNHPNNLYLQSTLANTDDLVLDIGFNIHSRSFDTLATLGRDSTDITIQGSTISRLQCSFEIDLKSKVVMLYDRSTGHTTQVFGEGATPFENGRLRRVVVQDGLNTIIGMGGVRCDQIQFELVWHEKTENTMEQIESRKDGPHNEKSALARTSLDTTALPSRMTRIHTAVEQNTAIGQKRKIRYHAGYSLGSGRSGTVYRCIDVDSGMVMAVKIVEPPAGKSYEAWRQEVNHALKREVETLSDISHPHIIDYIGAQGWDEGGVEIFMGLKEGNLNSLFESRQCLPTEDIARILFPQMLQALDCLAYKGIIHRDVKPENILYVQKSENKYDFLLADFGLCNRATDSATFAGSRIYMAPEMSRLGGQMSKLDVWSLFVTVVWTLNIENFRSRSVYRFKSVEDVQDAVLHIASTDHRVSDIREMAVVNPHERASAAQMLVKLYQGAGLSTPRKRVLPLIDTSVATTKFEIPKDEV